MEIDQLLSEILSEGTPPAAAAAVVPTSSNSACGIPESDIAQKRRKLCAAVAGGVFKTSLSVADLAKASDAKISELYVEYESQLGKTIVSTIGQTAIQLYVDVAQRVLALNGLCIPNEKPFVTDLDADPFLKQALSDAGCNLYFNYGKWLAPLSVALITAKHCQNKPPDSTNIAAQSLSQGTITEQLPEQSLITINSNTEQSLS
jgi:hypothetical protein